MEVVSVKQEDMTAYKKNTNCVVYSVHVKINDIDVRAKEMIEIISNTSWINSLNIVDQVTFRARSKKTIEKLVNDIFEKIEGSATIEFGEYMVSDTAQTVLNTDLDHTKVPLAELLKEKVTGNPGFDFHTESQTCLIAFGEAKYSGSSNPYSNAMNQIFDFVELNKDDMELSILEKFVSDDAVKNFTKNNKAYVAAFSINSVHPEKIITNALKSKSINKLLNFNELYVIGVEIDD